MNQLQSRAALSASTLSGLAAAALLALGSISPVQAQPAGQMKSLSHNIHAVDDLDTTLAFYRDVFGLEGRALDFANPAVPLLTNAPGVTLRMSMLTLPGGTRYELTHFKGLERKPGASEVHGPGCRERGPLRARPRRPGGGREESERADRHDGRRPRRDRDRERPRALDRAARPGWLFLTARRGSARGGCARRPDPPHVACVHDGGRRRHAAVLHGHDGRAAHGPHRVQTRRVAGEAVRCARNSRVPQARGDACRPAPPSSSRSFAAYRARNSICGCAIPARRPWRSTSTISKAWWRR